MIAQYIANGLLIGSLYACLAVGFSLIYGVLNIINVMHGSFVVLGAYVTIYCTLYLGVSPLIAAMIGCAVLFAFGYLVQPLLAGRQEAVHVALLDVAHLAGGDEFGKHVARACAETLREPIGSDETAHAQ